MFLVLGEGLHGCDYIWEGGGIRFARSILRWRSVGLFVYPEKGGEAALFRRVIRISLNTGKGYFACCLAKARIWRPTSSRYGLSEVATKFTER